MSTRWSCALLLTLGAEGLPETIHVGGELHDALARHGRELAESGASRGTPALMHEALADISKSESIPIRGLWIFTQDVQELEVPQELLAADVLQLAIHVQCDERREPLGTSGRDDGLCLRR